MTLPGRTSIVRGHPRFTGTIAVVALSLSLTMPKRLHAQTVDILYPPGGSLLDRLCATDFRVPVSDAAVAAAVRLRPELQRRWDADGPRYLKAATDEIGAPIAFREIQATLTVCLPASTSVPLVVDVLPFLPTSTKRSADWEFAEIVFHEILHTYVGPALSQSALMRKYEHEPPTTRYHLHVMAVEQMTLKKLDMSDRLAQIDHEYRTGPDSAYRRAWEIVQAEGYEAFILELQTALRRPTPRIE